MCKIRFDVSQANTGDTITAIQGEYKLALAVNWIPFNVADINNPETPDITTLGVYDLRVRIQNQDGVFSEWFTDPNNPTFQIGNCNPVRNASPIANAGLNRTITLPTNSVTLNGSGSSDPDGTITSYAWTKISGLAGTISSPNAVSTSVTGLVAGTHTFRLTVTDNLGAQSSDTVTVTVGAANNPPNANAGSDRVLAFPTNSVTLNGSGSSDIDGSIVSYLWTKTSPLAANIANVNAASTLVTGMAVGTHTFQLRVTDNSGLTDTDTVTITVRRDIIIDPTEDCNPELECCVPDGNGGFRPALEGEACI